jgi:hypothetical protein
MHKNPANRNDQPKATVSADSVSDSERERQLELEIQAFAELLLDIYEWRCQRKKKSGPKPAPELSP